MKIHYFQRYHKQEDVATANTMLLISRLYMYSPNKFFQFLREQFFGDIEFEPEISIILQEKGEKSIPDATIIQPSFKLVVETKLNDWFYEEQLIKHLGKFNNEEYKVLITLSSELMETKKKAMIDEAIENYNKKHKSCIIHINTTFELLAQGIQNVITEHDYEMQDVIDDYLDYCNHDGLILTTNRTKMKMRLSGTTFDFNVAENVYYDDIHKGFSPHDYLGLYKEKSIKAVGKIIAIITAVLKDGELQYGIERGELTEERKQVIDKAREDAKKYGYVLDSHRYFFVDKFYKTDFCKKTPYAPLGSKMFDLAEELGVKELPETEKIALLLKNKTWR